MSLFGNAAGNFILTLPVTDEIVLVAVGFSRTLRLALDLYFPSNKRLLIVQCHPSPSGQKIPTPSGKSSNNHVRKHHYKHVSLCTPLAPHVEGRTSKFTVLQSRNAFSTSVKSLYRSCTTLLSATSSLRSVFIT